MPVDNDSDVKDVVMIGAGPSALSAAIYTTRENIGTVLYEKAAVGGLAAVTDLIDNYPGFPEGIEGLRLAEQLQQQAERFGAIIEYGEINGIKRDGGVLVMDVSGQEVRARAVLIATGSDYKKLGVPGEAEFYARGVHYCATCDGAFYRGKRLAVVGGGNSGVQEAIFLTRFTAHIDLLVRSRIKASDILQRELKKFVDSGRITVHLDTTTNEIVADDGRVNGVNITTEDQSKILPVDGVFVFIGLKPNTGFLASSEVKLDPIGLIETDEHLRTSMPGVFASGDVRSGATMQIASAVGEGAKAAINIREYLESLDREPVVLSQRA